MLDVNEKSLQRSAALYGITNISVASMRREPVYQAEIVNQMVLGTIVPIYEEQNDFFYVENWDGYLGWVSKASLKTVNKAEAKAWHRASRLLVTGLYGRVSERACETSDTLTDLVLCAMLKQLESGPDYHKVELPDGRTGYVQCALTVDATAGKMAEATKQGVEELARKFLGIPYLWGGTSTKALDCSGFVQTVFRMLNIALPRDASHMAALGTDVELDHGFTGVQTGDLILFGKTVRRITHVALSLGNSLFIHAEGRVRINSLDPAHDLYAEQRHKTFLLARRILSNQADVTVGE